MNKNILIIEDDHSIAQLIKDYLSAYGYDVVLCGNGLEGEKRALSTPFDLILLDIMLPGKDGFLVCTELRKHLDIPILMVTAKQEDIDTIRGLGLGADDYITKPFSPSTLVARVKAHIERYERLKGSTEIQRCIQIRELKVFPENRQVTLKDQDIALTVKEFDMLYLMASHPNRVFSREELFDRIWGVESLGDTSTVTVHIKNLRDKIEADSSKPQYIETVWGIGYRMRV